LKGLFWVMPAAFDQDWALLNSQFASISE